MKYTIANRSHTMCEYSKPMRCSELTVGDNIERTYKPLSVQLGPGIMDTIFDGIQRPLNTIADESKDVYVPRGVDVQSLNPIQEFEFKPLYFREGDPIGPGDVFGIVRENEIMHTHKIMCPPNIVRALIGISLLL